MVAVRDVLPDRLDGHHLWSRGARLIRLDGRRSVAYPDPGALWCAVIRLDSTASDPWSPRTAEYARIRPRSYGSPGAFRRAFTDKLRDLTARSRLLYPLRMRKIGRLPGISDFVMHGRKSDAGSAA